MKNLAETEAFGLLKAAHYTIKTPQRKTKMTDTNCRRIIRAINKAVKNGWNPQEWPMSDAKFELDCCLSTGELLADQDFRKHLGDTEWIKLVNKLILPSP